MSVAAEKTRLKTFHATMAVTRMEEWCVDAETPEEARLCSRPGTGTVATVVIAFTLNWRK